MIKYGIITHYYFYGSCQALYDFLKNKNNVSMVEIPLDFDEKFLKKEILVSQEKTKKKFKIISVRNKILNYFIQFYYSFYFQTKYFKKIDHVISCNPFNCIITIILKRFLSIKKISYFSIDYSAKRFDYHLLNKIYLYLDLLCYYFSDENWDISPKMYSGRIKNFSQLNKLKIKKKIKIVPVGIWKNEIKKINNKKKINFAYIGDINERSGSYDILNYLKMINKSKFRFFYVGDGEIKNKIKKKIKKLKLEKNIFFIDWVNQKKLLKILSNIDFGFAPYRNLEHNKNMFPTKIITFLSKSIPVFTTDHNFFCKKIIDVKAGIKLSKNNFKKNFDKIRVDIEYKRKLSNNAFKLSEDYKWQKIFKEALNI